MERRGWLLALMIFATGCLGRVTVPLNDYRAAATSAPPAAVEVRLQILDARKVPAEGGSLVIGQWEDMREIRITDPDMVRHVVGAATTDALRRAGVAVADRAPRLLLARIVTYWVDLPQHRGPRVGVELELRDRDGATLWRDSAEGFSGGIVFSELARSGLARMFSRALDRYVEVTTERFRAPDFQARLY